TKVEHISNGVTEDAEETTHYVVSTENLEDDCDFEINFTRAFCDHLETNDNIVITYTAMLNRNAVVAGNGNANVAYLAFGEGHKTLESSVVTYTYSVDIIKTDSQNTLIDGASFRIYDALTGGNEIEVVLTDDGKAYRRINSENEVGQGVDIVVKDGQARVIGLDNGTYYLEEVEAPDGYNKLTARHAFTISDGNLDAVFTNDIYSVGSGVQIVNKSGSMLPETGGIGTTLFYVAGGFLVATAVVVLVSKKRMSSK
ncbi:MAG: LPXTG cell wall anchor domain-containing protein, partial [Oscillospiraceae bacterium]|nr:LPXTG cell wall anchor domain-containing protein [Oscillospiraceae bacterium]